MSDPASTHPPKGKIARLPWTIREAVNHRLLNGETYPTIAAWLNALPEVKRILEDQFGGQEISPQNLSNWRSGGYADWIAEREEVEAAKQLAQFSAELAEASGEFPTAGAKALATGRVLARLTKLGEEADLETLDALVLAISRLAKADAAAATVKLNRARTQQAERQLDLAEEKFRRETAALFLKWAKDQKALEIATRTGDTEVNMAALIEHIWGAKPPPPPPRSGAVSEAT